MWTTLSGTELDIDEFLKQHACDGREVFIGTDSQRKNKQVLFSTVIALVKKNDNHVIKRMHYTELFPSLRDRLIHEAWMSLEVAQKISKMISQNITIHLDVNQNPKFKSGLYKNEICGFVKGFGYDYKLKPDSWCASSVADHQVQ